MRVGGLARGDVANARGTAAARPIVERDRNGDQFVFYNDSVNDPGQQIGATAHGEWHDELDLLGGHPAGLGECTIDGADKWNGCCAEQQCPTV